MIGIAGAPGVGKSTLTEALADELGALVAILPMDGFHLPRAELTDAQLARRGAPDTFDAAGFIATLRLVRAGEPVTAPGFDRRIEDPTPGVHLIAPATPIVLVDGNYLLLDEEPWRGVLPLLDECWLLELDDEVRRARLVLRHAASGKSHAEAVRFATESDEANARLITASAHRATARIAVD